MYKNLVLFLVILSVTASSALFANTKLKIGTVEFRRAMVEVKQGKAAKKRIEKAVQKKQKSIVKIENSLKALEGKLQVASEKKRPQLQKEFQEKLKDYQTKRMTIPQEIQKLEIEETSGISKRMRDVARDIARDKGLDHLIENSAGTVLYSVNKVDITEELIRKYDKKYKK